MKESARKRNDFAFNIELCIFRKNFIIIVWCFVNGRFIAVNLAIDTAPTGTGALAPYIDKIWPFNAGKQLKLFL